MSVGYIPQISQILKTKSSEGLNSRTFAMIFTGLPYAMILGGFIGSFSDDYLEVRTDIILNEMIPSEQRATLISVNSFMFSLIMIVMSTLMGSIM